MGKNYLPSEENKNTNENEITSHFVENNFSDEEIYDPMMDF
jgi:hypothetical protein